ncbi:DHA2 family efflux MFS transporter permease subunit [Herbiconiux sp. CPCC 205763]|uniref:DHA2 family efflux MFS transporter permease subunit n=1 Tax=Herbiconiux aconitum TaxID=2970913 RepID=A0ABT2GUJ3_9MICO|nr:DHA2 family efflux MFS transporter permease subunit [Herbiconiux aconitum]MCS5719877.1 DHA2 family efflux MFS transporter permease subunit [Herbiconiux aconitum]
MTRQQKFVLVVAVLSSFISFLDATVINVALPAISEELGGGLASQQWVVDSYLLTLGAVILLAGSLSDVYGRKKVLLVGLIGFGVTSLACAFAPSIEFLIVARGLQGIAGALLVPSSLALILANFTGMGQGRAIGTWTAFTSAANIAGPIIGGVLVDSLTWRFVFIINVVPIAITLYLLTKLAPDLEHVKGTRIDYVGAVLGIVGLGFPVFALIEQTNFGWGSPVVMAPLVVGVIALVLFVLWEQRTAQPMLPLELFRVRNFSVGNVSTFLIYGALSLGFFSVAVFLQQVAGYSATLAGFALVPTSILLIGLSSPFGRLSGRIGPRLFMTIGPILSGIGFLLMLRFTDQAPYVTEVLPAVVVFGLGMAITVAPLTAAILGAIEPARSGIASAVNNAVSRVAGLIAVALASVIAGMTVLDLIGFHRVVLVTAVFFFAGGLVSLIGIQNPKRLPRSQRVTSLHQED